MLARIRAGVRALVDAVEGGGERRDDREDSAVVRGVGDDLFLSPIPFLLLLLTVGRRLLLLVQVLVVRSVLVIPGITGPAIGAP